MPKITFCIPFYSDIDYLKETIQSVLVQSIDDWRLIVVDDCGPDGAAASHFLDALQDARIQYVRNEYNLGLARNWNRCLDLATTDLVQILHADDRLKPDYAKKMVEAFSIFKDASVLFCNADIIDKNSQPKFSFGDWYKKFLRPSDDWAYKLEGPTGILQLVYGDFVMCPTMVYRKSKLRGRRFDERWRMVLDLDFKFRLLLDGDHLVGLTEKLYEYRRHNKNQTTLMTKDLLRFREEIAILSEMASKARELNWGEIEKVASAMRIIRLNLCYCIVIDTLFLRFSYASRKLRFLLQEVKPRK